MIDTSVIIEKALFARSHRYITNCYSFDVLKSATGVDMADIMRAGSIEAKTTRNINLNDNAQDVIDGITKE